jgi:hypothetical protein
MGAVTHFRQNAEVIEEVRRVAVAAAIEAEFGVAVEVVHVLFGHLTTSRSGNKR